MSHTPQHLATCKFFILHFDLKTCWGQPKITVILTWEKLLWNQLIRVKITQQKDYEAVVWVSRVSPLVFALTNGEPSRLGLHYHLMPVICPLSTCLIPNVSLSFPQQIGTTVSWETKLFMTENREVQFSWYDVTNYFSMGNFLENL